VAGKQETGTPGQAGQPAADAVGVVHNDLRPAGPDSRPQPSPRRSRVPLI
jgi:hypothetical protein